MIGFCTRQFVTCPEAPGATAPEGRQSDLAITCPLGDGRRSPKSNSYQINFSANWISRLGTWVPVI